MFAERTMGLAEHFVGDQARARRHLEHALALDTVDHRGGDLNRFQDIVRFGTDPRLSAQAFLARVLWLRGSSRFSIQNPFVRAETGTHRR